MVGQFHPPGIRRFVAAVLVAISMFVVSCDFSDLSEFDLFPSYLKKAQASISLKSILSSQEFDSDFEITRIEQLRLTAEGTSFVLVFLKDETKQLLIVLYEDLSIAHVEKNDAFTSFLGLDVQDRFLCGSASFIQGDAYATSDASLTSALTQFDGFDHLASVGGNGYNALLGSIGSNIRLLDFTTEQSWATYTDYSAPLADTSGYQVLDILRGDETSDLVRVLMRRDDRIVVADFEDYAALRNAINAASTLNSNFVSKSSPTTGPFYDGHQAWVTRDGVVVTNEKDGQLIQYPFSDLTAENAIDIGKKYEDAFVSIDAEGDRWFLFDYESNWLYALRTWW